MKTVKVVPIGIRLLLVTGLLFVGKEMGALAGTGARPADNRSGVIVKSCSMMLKVSGNRVNNADPR